MAIETTTVLTHAVHAEVPKKQRLHLLFLDGLRGLAALYIVLFHVLDSKYPLWLQTALAWTRYGHISVAIFIVLSGFCLMLPVVRSGNGAIPGGLKEYFFRRALRILPSYYLAFLLACLLVGSSVYLKQHTATQADAGGSLKSIFVPMNMIAHALLVHNLVPEWAQTIDPPLWSVATEWQIYFFFPFILLPVWRRVGNIAVVLVGLGIGLTLIYATPFGRQFTSAYSWYLGLFAMGMAGASIAFSDKASSNSLTNRINWGVLAIMGLGVFILFTLFLALGTDGQNSNSLMWVSDSIVGLSTMALLIYCARRSVNQFDVEPKRRSLALKILECRPAVILGTFSYSLYLVHVPISYLFPTFVRKIHVTGASLFAFQFFIEIPLVIVMSYLFYLICEKPFLNLRKKIASAKEIVR